jgi:deoxyribodipyrimidine photo-lyase
MPAPVVVVWFRRDLRIADHPALQAAAEAGAAVVPLFVVDPRLMTGRDAPREAALRAALGALAGELRGLGAPLVIRRGDPRDEVARAAREAGAQAVHWSHDFTPYARRRDAAVTAACAAVGVAARGFSGSALVDPADLATSTGGFYTIFTPFHRAWSSVSSLPPLPAPGRLTPGPRLAGEAAPAAGADAGHAVGRAALERFVRGRLAAYERERDRVDHDGTSRLSVHLRVGALSPREVRQVVERAAVRDGRLRGAAGAFVRQLAWRDFFTHVLWHAPESRRQALRADRRAIAWRADPAALAAWQEGRTGYPFVDAGMRQLAATGFMPNRARLVAASFLTKHLLIDWREGERWFMRCLRDGDPAVNAGNWQWVASTGADALPAFRIFNPVAQGRRFDPDGAWVRRFVPEVAAVPAAHVHEPWTAGGAPGYPPPIVEHGEARRRALLTLGATRDSGASAPSDGVPGRPGRRGRRSPGAARGGESA